MSKRLSSKLVVLPICCIPKLNMLKIGHDRNIAEMRFSEGGILKQYNHFGCNKKN